MTGPEETTMNSYIAQQVGFLRVDNWLEVLGQKKNPDLEFAFRNLLNKAQPGMGYCMDERPPLYPAQKNDKPAFVGGAAGWMVMFMMHGQDFEEAFRNTKLLYENLAWGVLEAHTDDHHGDITDPDEVNILNEGCGFLKVWPQVVTTLKGVFTDLNLTLPDSPVEGPKFIEKIRKEGGAIVPLTGDHKLDEAAVVVNFVPDTTLDVRTIYETTPAFRWDAWATSSDPVLTEFKRLANRQEMTSDQFVKLQVGLHLVTGLYLNAVRLEGPKRNLVILS